MKYDCKNCEYGQLNKDRDKTKRNTVKIVPLTVRIFTESRHTLKRKKIKPATAGYFLV